MAVAVFPGGSLAESPAISATAAVSPESAQNGDVFETRAIERVQEGDRGGYDYLIDKYMRRVVSIAWSIVRNAADAEDLAQEAFVRAYRNMGRFRAGQSFGPWIYRIVTNLALDQIKHRMRFRHEPFAGNEPAPRRDAADVPALATELGRRIDEAIESLPRMQRVVARLFLVEQFDHREIAAMMNLSEGTVRSHLSLARARLREKLGDMREES